MEVGETRLISDFSTVLTSKLIISHHTPSIKVYYIANRAPELKREPIPYKEKNEAVILADEMLMESHFLNKNSALEVYFSSFHGITVYIFDGNANYKSWAEDITPSTWVIQKLVKGTQVLKIRYEIQHSNVYYIVFKNENEYQDSSIVYNITLDRTEYVLDGKLPLCKEFDSKCVIDLNALDHGHIYLQSLQYSHNESLHPYTDVLVEGDPRWNYIFVIFFLFPNVCVFVIFGVYSCLRGADYAVKYDTLDASSSEAVGLLNQQHRSLESSPDRVGRHRADSPIGFLQSSLSTTPIARPIATYHADRIYDTSTTFRR
jgi:hypothetical protein